MNSPNTTLDKPEVGLSWLWAVRISLVFSALSCVPLLVKESAYWVLLAVYGVLEGLLIWQPVRGVFLIAAFVGGFVFYVLALPEVYWPRAGSWEYALVFTFWNLALALTAWEAQARFDSPKAAPTEDLGSPRWVAAVRILTVVSTVPVLVIIGLAYAASRRGPCAEKYDWLLFWSIPAFVPYVGILWQLRKRSRSRGLALAAATGLGWVIPFTFLWPGFRDHLGKLTPWIVLFAVVQLALFASAFKLLRTKRPEEGWIFRGLALFFVYIFVGVSIQFPKASSLVQERISFNHYRAVNSIREVLAAETTYAERHQGSFSPSLAALGPPPGGTWRDGLIDAVLARGAKSGYLFAYTPGPPDATGRVKSFALVARPTEYGNTGCLGYSSDQSGVIRSTRENRPPYPHDPPLNSR